jgi:hypothetical protein
MKPEAMLPRKINDLSLTQPSFVFVDVIIFFETVTNLSPQFRVVSQFEFQPGPGCFMKA